MRRTLQIFEEEGKLISRLAGVCCCWTHSFLIFLFLVFMTNKHNKTVLQESFWDFKRTTRAHTELSITKYPFIKTKGNFIMMMCGELVVFGLAWDAQRDVKTEGIIIFHLINYTFFPGLSFLRCLFALFSHHKAKWSRFAWAKYLDASDLFWLGRRSNLGFESWRVIPLSSIYFSISTHLGRTKEAGKRRKTVLSAIRHST